MLLTDACMGNRPISPRRRAAVFTSEFLDQDVPVADGASRFPGIETHAAARGARGRGPVQLQSDVAAGLARDLRVVHLNVPDLDVIEPADDVRGVAGHADADRIPSRRLPELRKSRGATLRG